MFWLQKYMQSPAMVSLASRPFSGGHGGHGHEEHGHEQHVTKASPDHQFIQKQEKRFIAFEGLKPTAPALFTLENPYRHHNEMPLIK